MVDSLEQRLKRAVDTRNQLAATVQKLQGRLESARDALAAVDQECRSKGLDPDSLDAHIASLELEYSNAVSSLESKIADLQESLSPFTEEIR